jgi:hypothetical protein
MDNDLHDDQERKIELVQECGDRPDQTCPHYQKNIEEREGVMSEPKICPIMSKLQLEKYSETVYCFEEKCQLWVTKVKDETSHCALCERDFMKEAEGHCGLINSR